MLHVGDYVTWENVKRERPDEVIPQKALEYKSVGYDPKMKKYVFYNKNKEAFFKTEAECRQICLAKFVKQLKHHWNSNKYFDLKIGNSLADTEVLEDTSLPKIHYQQGEFH